MEKPQDKSVPSDLQEQSPGNVLEALARKGARQLLAQAMEAEVSEFVGLSRSIAPSPTGRVDVWSCATGTCQSGSL